MRLRPESPKRKSVSIVLRNVKLGGSKIIVKNMKFIIDHTGYRFYKYHSSRLSCSTEQFESSHTTAKHNTNNTMKNIKLNTSRKAGFSLVEMLVVIAIIGIIAAIAIPNIGNLNESARDAAAKRNAQTVASVLNAAIAAGATADFAAIADGSAGAAGLVTLAQTGTSPTDGAFQSKNFTSGPIDDDEESKVAGYLSWDAANKQVKYDAGN